MKRVCAIGVGLREFVLCCWCDLALGLKPPGIGRDRAGFSGMSFNVGALRGMVCRGRLDQQNETKMGFWAVFGPDRQADGCLFMVF